MVQLLAGKTGTVCAIGDPNQAIYGFRGASPEFFTRFKQDFPGAEEISLKKCFRSSDQILMASNDLLAEKATLRSGISGNKLRIVESATEAAEAESVVSEIEKLVGGTGFFSFDSSRVQTGAGGRGKSFSDFAVLFRAGSQAAALVEAFGRSGMPYRLVSESPLQSKFFRTGVWAMSIIAGKANALTMNLALKQIFKDDAGLPKKPADLKKWLGQTNEEPAKILGHLLEKAEELNAVEICGQVFSLAAVSEEESTEKETVKDMVIDLVRRKASQYMVRSAEQVLEILTMASAQDFFDPIADRVSLLTIHSAKGLEFDVVFVVGCEEGLLPHIASQSTRELEEEKRLFYVALTRAKNLVYLCRAQKRMIYGKTVKTEPSRFLQRIKKDLLEPMKSAPLPARPRQNQLDLF
jgi:DNA helicase II / ATP-dependent DNA helicase PcrA